MSFNRATIRWVISIAAGLSLLSAPAFAAPKVVVSIKPLHSLVAAVMQGIDSPELLVGGNASPHTYQLKPSQARLLQDADIIFWTGQGLEAFLEKPLASLAANASIVELDKAPGLIKLPLREGGTFEEHLDEAPGGEAHHDEVDMHLWLDTNNAKSIAAEIERNLALADPENAARYQANLLALHGRLDSLAEQIAAIVAPIKDRPFVVFHDAYHYFENQFGVKVSGSITVSPEVMPGADRVSEIHAKVSSMGVTCVFAEPQFEPAIINVVLEGSSAKSGILDPEAGSLAEGPDLYFDMMLAIANNLRDCLGDGK